MASEASPFPADLKTSTLEIATKNLVCSVALTGVILLQAGRLASEQRQEENAPPAVPTSTEQTLTEPAEDDSAIVEDGELASLPSHAEIDAFGSVSRGRRRSHHDHLEAELSSSSASPGPSGSGRSSSPRKRDSSAGGGNGSGAGGRKRRPVVGSLGRRSSLRIAEATSSSR